MILSNKKLRKVKRDGSKTWCFVYALIDPRTNEKKYIGQTRCLPKTRLKFHYRSLANHFHAEKNLSPVMKWLKELQTLEMKPTVEVIEHAGTWDITEAVWIDRLTNQGVKLLNVASRVR